jgi:hypothetical protein
MFSRRSANKWFGTSEIAAVRCIFLVIVYQSSPQFAALFLVVVIVNLWTASPRFDRYLHVGTVGITVMSFVAYTLKSGRIVTASRYFHLIITPTIDKETGKPGATIDKSSTSGSPASSISELHINSENRNTRNAFHR